jgi:hypothetical protein
VKKNRPSKLRPLRSFLFSMDTHRVAHLACSESNMHYYTPAVMKDIVGSDYKPYPHGIINSNDLHSLERHAVEKSPIPASNNGDLLCLKPSPSCFGTVVADQLDDIRVSEPCPACNSTRSCFGTVAADQLDDIRVSEPCAACNSPICKPALHIIIYDPVRRMTCLPAPPPVRFLKRRKPQQPVQGMVLR